MKTKSKWIFPRAPSTRKIQGIHWLGNSSNNPGQGGSNYRIKRDRGHIDPGFAGVALGENEALSRIDENNNVNEV